MEQYIPKSAVVAEIERIKQKLLDHIICESDKEWAVRTAHQLNRIIYFLDTLEVKEVDLNYNKKTAILSSSHQEVARLFVNSLDWVYGMANPKAEDLLKVIDITGKVYWCDEIEFIENE